MKALIFVLLVISSAIKLSGQPNAKNQNYIIGEVVIKFKSGVLDKEWKTSSESVKNFEKGFFRSSLLDSVLDARKAKQIKKLFIAKSVKSISRNGEEIDVSDIGNIQTILLPDSTNIKKFCEYINTLPGIEYAEPNYILNLNGNPNDNNFSSQLSLDNVNNTGDINASRAWDFASGLYTVKVGIIDTGIDYHNPDLGNGLWNADGTKVRAGWNYYLNNNDPDDSNINDAGHGTKVAGIIGAFRNNTTGVAGIAGGNGRSKGVQLYGLKAFNNQSSTSTIVAAAIIKGSLSTEFGCHILNLSLGSSAYSSIIRDAMRVAVQNNVVVIASKGNNGTNSAQYPADHDKNWVIAVGASNAIDERLSDSNYGFGLDVVAPGQFDQVYTTTTEELGRYDNFHRTSAAAPHVSGLAALIKSVNLNLHRDDVEGIIRESAFKNPTIQFDANGYNQEVGFGRIDAGKAMEIMAAPNVLSTHSETGGSSAGNTGYYLQYFTNVSGGPLNGWYMVKRHDVRKTVTVSAYQNNQFYAWGRGVNVSSGWSNTPEYQLGYSHVVSKTATTVTLQTYVYEVATQLYQFIGWYPSQPSNVQYAYTLLGVPEFMATIGGPDLLPYNSQATWTAYGTNCNNSLSYQWYRKPFTSSTWSPTVTTQNYTGTITENTNLRVDITCGTQTKTANLNVYLDIGQLRASVESPEVKELNHSVQFNCKPNPFSNLLEVEYLLHNESYVSIRVLDVTGRACLSIDEGLKESGLHNRKVETEQLASGIYYLILTTDLGTNVVKVVK